MKIKFTSEILRIFLKWTEFETPVYIFNGFIYVSLRWCHISVNPLRLPSGFYCHKSSQNHGIPLSQERYIIYGCTLNPNIKAPSTLQLYKTETLSIRFSIPACAYRITFYVESMQKAVNLFQFKHKKKMLTNAHAHRQHHKFKADKNTENL